MMEGKAISVVEWICWAFALMFSFTLDLGGNNTPLIIQIITWSGLITFLLLRVRSWYFKSQKNKYRSEQERVVLKDIRSKIKNKRK